MLTICTLADKNYLHKGITLWLSLKQTGTEKFILHFLCIDESIFDELQTLNLDGVQLYLLSDLEKSHPELIKAKSNPPSKYGTQYSNYCWCLTPFFTNYVLTKKSGPEGVFYIDADILMLQPLDIIVKIIWNKSIGIHTHRFTPPKHDTESGWYNVGIVYFKNDACGRMISEKWKNWMLQPDHEYYEKYGACGDQKYLELFAEFAGAENVCVFDDNTNITHLAPWCPDIEPDKICVFFHFSHFVHNYENGTWSDSINGEWNPAKDPAINKYYEMYNKLIIDARAMIKPKLSIVGNIRLDSDKPERFVYLLCCIHSYSFLGKYAEIILNVENCTPEQQSHIKYELQSMYVPFQLFFVDGNNYGDAYMHLLSKAKYSFILNFFEDHFCVTNEQNLILGLLKTMEEKKIDVLKASFSKVENLSIRNISQKQYSAYGYYFLNNAANFAEYCRHYKSRYYLGVNFITTKAFALKFWNRQFNSKRPHDWEIINYNADFEHVCMVPGMPVIESVDDDHGEEGTKLIGNSNFKFNQLYDIFEKGLKS